MKMVRKRLLREEYGIDATTYVQWVLIDTALRLYHTKVVEYEDKVKAWAKSENIMLTQNQFDALTIQAYNKWRPEIAEAYVSTGSKEDRVRKVIDEYKQFKGWDVHGPGWENRIRCQMDVFMDADYAKKY